MTCIEKFTFSRSFPAFPGAQRTDDRGAAVPQPVHSDDDLARARSEAHAAGYGEGYAAGVAVGRKEAAAAAHAAREQRELEVLAQLCEHLERAVGERDTIAAEAERGALALALTGLRKSLPALHRRHGADEIAAMIADLPASPAGLVTLNVTGPSRLRRRTGRQTGRHVGRLRRDAGPRQPPDRDGGSRPRRRRLPNRLERRRRRTATVGTHEPH